MDALRLRLSIVAAGLLAAAPAAAQTANLTVYARMSGAGAVGRVELAPGSAPTTPAISCRTDGTAGCVASAAVGATVLLQAVDVSNATFVSWKGCTATIPTGPTTPPQCSVRLASAWSVTASFKATTFALTARTYPTPPGTYGGRLQAPSEPPIDCQSGSATYTACTGAVANGASITVAAVPSPGSKVSSWTGCTVVDATHCTVAMTAARLVSATFAAGNVAVTAQVSGSGTIAAPAGGSVVDGMSCPSDCTAEVVPGGSITLTATPAAGYELAGWTGCSSFTSTCTLSGLTAPASVTATFRIASCSSCHGLPPPSPHVARSDCGTCHPGYTSTSVAPSLHLNGRVDPTHADALGDTCTTDPAIETRCVTCHPCQGP